MNRLLSLLIAITLSLWGGAAWAAEHASAKDAEALLSRAIDKLNEDGPAKAFAVFNDPKGGYFSGDLYVFVFDMKGVYRASGLNPDRTGKDAIDMRDVDGKYLVREMVEIAKTSGEGWVNYAWINPATGRIDNKHSIVRKVGEYIVGVGYYTGDGNK